MADTTGRLVKKLLSRQVGRWQMAGFVLANLLGMTIVLAAVQFARDVMPVFTSGDSFMRPGQMVLVKRVSTLRTLSGKAPTFGKAEVDELRRQPFVNSVGEFVPSRFGVTAAVGGGGMAMSTEMFFEAVPDEYIDVARDRWRYREGSDSLPIILPQNYLNLYNFGFATSKGLPTVSAELVGQVPIRLTLRGNGEQWKMVGKVVGFSKTLNTILVPMDFMEKANSRLSDDGGKTRPARLMVQVDNPADERLATFLRDNRYDTEGHDADASRTAAFLRMLVGGVGGVGLVISALAFYVLLLSIFLLLQKHTDKIDTLLLIGHSPQQVARPFIVLALTLNGVVLAVALVAVALLRHYYIERIAEVYPQLETGSMAPAIVTGGALLALVALLNFKAINRKVMTIWHLHET